MFAQNIFSQGWRPFFLEGSYFSAKQTEVTSKVSITGWPFVPGKMPEVQVILSIELMANM